MLRDVLTSLETEGAAIGHFNVADQVLLKAVIAAAAETKLPVFGGASEGEMEFFGARQGCPRLMQTRSMLTCTRFQAK